MSPSIPLARSSGACSWPQHDANDRNALRTSKSVIRSQRDPSCGTKIWNCAGCGDAAAAWTVSMVRLKKASRPLTRKQQINNALELLVLSRKKFKLPVLSQDEREQCCMHIAELVDTMASVRADAERPQPTRATYRAALAALKRHKKT